jgi:hypothetical protein
MIFTEKDGLKEINNNNMSYFNRIFLVFICIVLSGVIYISLNSPTVNNTARIKQLAIDRIDRSLAFVHNALLESNASLNVPTMSGNKEIFNANISNMYQNHKLESDNGTIRSKI